MRVLFALAILLASVWAQTPCIIQRETCFSSLCGCNPSINFCDVIPRLLNATQNITQNAPCACTNTTIIQPAACGCTNTTIIQPVVSPIEVAEYVQKIQSPNNSVPPGNAFMVATGVITTPSIVASSGAGGTVWSLALGTYAIDYEMSLTSAGSIALMHGATVGTMTIDTDTIAGATTGTTWIHARSILVVTSPTFFVAVTSDTGTASVPTAGTAAGFFMVRVTFVKLA